MMRHKGKFVRVTTIYNEVITGIVIKKPLITLDLKTDNGIISIWLNDIKDIEILGDAVE